MPYPAGSDAADEKPDSLPDHIIRAAERLQRALTVLRVPHDVKVYPGSGHRFMSEALGAGAVLARLTRMSYQEADAADAWQRIYAFFGEHLGDNLAG